MDNKAKLTECVVRLQNGDGKVFEEIYKMTYHSAYFTALKITKNEQDAEDVLQNAYVKALERINSLMNPDSFTGWFNMIIANEAKNMLRKNKPELFTDNIISGGKDDSEEFSVFDNIEDDNEIYRPGADIETDELQREVMGLIDDLSDEKRTAVLLYYYDEMTTKQISESLGVSESTIKSRLVQAKKDLSKGVAELEKKNIRLRGLAPIPVLIWALRFASAKAGNASIASGTASTVYKAVRAGKTAASAAGAAVSISTAAASATHTAANTAAASQAAATAVKAAAKAGTVSAGQAAVKGAAPAAAGKITEKAAKAVINGADKADKADTAKQVAKSLGKSTAKSIIAKRVAAAVVSVGVAAGGAAGAKTIIDNRKEAAAETTSITETTEQTTLSTTAPVTIVNSGSCGAYVTFELDSAGKLTISGTGEMDDLSAFIGSSAPWADSSEVITEVVIGDGITSIGSSAFLDFINLTKVTIGKDVKSIGRSAFSGCTNLKNIRLPSGLLTIGSFSFGDCSLLDGVVLPESLTSMGEGAFENCISLTTIRIPGLITDISMSCFSGCKNLKTATFAKNVTTVGISAFDGCISLTDIYCEGSESEQSVTYYTDFGTNEELRSVTWHHSGATETTASSETSSEEE